MMIIIRVVVTVTSTYPVLQLPSLMRYFFINSKCIKRYIDVLNLYRIFYDILWYRFIVINGINN
jgi:hypothetical protein